VDLVDLVDPVHPVDPAEAVDPAEVVAEAAGAKAVSERTRGTVEQAIAVDECWSAHCRTSMGRNG